MMNDKVGALPCGPGSRPSDRAADGVSPVPASIPNAGVCAFDLDECTVTFALDSEEEVVALVKRSPWRSRVGVCAS
jgi:hypothetical protein